MSRRRYISIFLIFALLISGYMIYNPQLLLRSRVLHYESLGIEMMSVPMDTQINEYDLGESLMISLDVIGWKKQWDFQHDFVANKYIMNIDDKYVLWIDYLDESTEVCKVSLRHGGHDLLTGWYKMPAGTIENIDEIIDVSNIEWNVMN